jgi:hypothetical protein
MKYRARRLLSTRETMLWFLERRRWYGWTKIRGTAYENEADAQRLIDEMAEERVIYPQPFKPGDMMHKEALRVFG